MNWQRIRGDWKQFRGQIKERWSDLTDKDLDRIEGQRDQLIERIEDRYGVNRERAEREVREWEEDIRSAF